MLNNTPIQNEDEFVDYLALRIESNLKQIPDTYDILDTDMILHYEDEVRRKGDFSLLFPLKDSIEYYSKFILIPDRENLILWNWIKNKKKEKLNNYEEICKTKSLSFFE